MALCALATPPPAAQFATPLDYLLADHFRQRTLCRMIDQIANAQERDDACIAAVLRFLSEDFGPHMLDEEEDLFPLLRRRAEPEDQIDDVLGALSQEHTTDGLDADAIKKGLAEVDAEGQFTPVFRDLLHRFAANEKRHLIVENAIVLPLARVRLKASDLRQLGRRMAARRGITYPGHTHAA